MNKITLKDGYYPSFTDVVGLAFPISIVMRADDLTPERQFDRREQAERLVQAWNTHEALLEFYRVAITPAGHTADQFRHLEAASAAVRQALDEAGVKP